MSGRILVTPRSVTRSGHPSLEKLRSAGYEIVQSRPGVQPDREELRGLLPGCVGYLAGVEPVSAEVLESATDLKVISRNGTGTDNIDLEAAARLGIQVLRAEGANARGVAELAMALMLSLARGVTIHDATLKRGEWARTEPGCELEGRTLGLIGFGRVGQLVARLALAFGMEVIAYDPFRPAGHSDSSVREGSLQEVVAVADFLSLHCPPRPDGRAVIDAAILQSMKRGVYLINTARHELIDFAAVRAALEAGQLAGFATDVLESESSAALQEIRHPRIVATPHIGGFTRESIDRAMHAAVDNLLAALEASA